ncbi:MAG TPA: LLM class flavin-dependent oxidoreductase [Xanthobacteraceae bacterium]|nr:LLM class flavin-dependent oxidoreductase [Xanthobacteraceae bacterium]
MKVCMFHLMPYRELPADYERRYNASHIEPVWFDVADADKVGQFYNATLDEMLYAAKAGMHGVCTNQHHQNVYGFMANPSLMGSVLARGTAGQNTAIIQLGSTLPSTTPPTRIAEEYAMLDCISGGRLVAGFPTGLPSDVTLSNGVVPIEQRERYREALALVTKAWSAREVFAWNGKYYQLGMVNLWPRPIQQPHPPIWIPGAGISATAEYVVDLDHCFCHLSYYGLKSAEEVSDRYWETCARKGRDDNPHRYSFLQLIGVAETDAEAERIYGPHAEYFFNKLLYNAPQYQQIPGCLEYEGMRSALRGTIRSSINLRELKAKDFFERGFVVVGSPKTVREKLLDGVKRLRIGHLLTLLHFGSMPTDVCKASIDLFAREVLPHLAPLWDDKYEDRWWPERLRSKRPAAAPALAAAS